MFPRLSAELSEHYLLVEPEDVISEVQHCVNTMLYYSGYSPYEILFGSNPNQIWDDETEHLTDGTSLFFEHQLVRSHAIAAFQKSMVLQAFSRLNHSRPAQA